MGWLKVVKNKKGKVCRKEELKVFDVVKEVLRYWKVLGYIKVGDEKSFVLFGFGKGCWVSVWRDGVGSRMIREEIDSEELMEMFEKFWLKNWRKVRKVVLISDVGRNWVVEFIRLDGNGEIKW